MDMQFAYVNVGWEGNVNDSRVLDEAISDPKYRFPWPPTSTINYMWIYLLFLIFYVYEINN